MDWELDSEDQALLEAACEAAEAAADVHRSRPGDLGSQNWREKGASDFVTDVDREAERLIVEAIRRRFPEHAILAEEESTGPAGDTSAEDEEARRAAGIRWVIDPLDGTTNWLHGYPAYAVSIAALDSAGLRLGVVLNSATGELFAALRGRGSRRNGEPIRVSAVSELRLALVGTGFPFKNLHVLPRYLEIFGEVLTATSGVRRAGAAALDLCDVACGRFDAFWELALMPWDFAAGILIIREAGGLVERVRIPREAERPEMDPGAGWGEPLWPGGVIAANPALFPAIRELVVRP